MPDRRSDISGSPRPRGFRKVSYFGLWHPAQRHNAARIRQMLQLPAPPKINLAQDDDPAAPPLVPPDAEPVPPIETRVCPHCQGRLVFIRMLTPQQAMAP